MTGWLRLCISQTPAAEIAAAEQFELSEQNWREAAAQIEREEAAREAAEREHAEYERAQREEAERLAALRQDS